MTSQGSIDPFLAKYDLAGNLQWVRSAGYTNSDYCYCIAADSANNVYMAGGFNYQISFGSNASLASRAQYSSATALCTASSSDLPQTNGA